MIFGAYREAGGNKLPRVLHISVARYSRNLPKAGKSLRFLVSMHEEGTGTSWQQNITVSPEDEQWLLDLINDLHLWSLQLGLTPGKAMKHVADLGQRLCQCFIGEQGNAYMSVIPPTALLLNVDETILNLPWELLRCNEPVALHIPFGRLVTTRIMPRPNRDPLKEDNVVRILAVANPTLDLSAADREIEALHKLEGDHGAFKIEVNLLMREKATKQAFIRLLSGGDYDMIHFAGHGHFDPKTPELSAIRFARGLLTAEEVLQLTWKSPPYLVFNSACETGRAAGGKRLFTGKNQGNGLAAAFIAAGVSAYAGYYWPVTDVGAGLFTEAFYQMLFLRENVGIAFLEARKHVVRELGEEGDLTGFSAVLFGDAASKHRRDLAMAK